MEQNTIITIMNPTMYLQKHKVNVKTVTKVITGN